MNNHFTSDISHKNFPLNEKIQAWSIQKKLFVIIQKDYPNFTQNSALSISELNKYRHQYIEQFLIDEVGILSDLEKQVITRLQNNETVSDKLSEEEEEQTKNNTFGQNIADQVASFGGSWTFILSFLFFILLWVLLNVFLLLNKGFDPYPFILLNLILSCIASLQAPIIMMSQNRQEEKDRQRAKNDYIVNLKSELEIQMLHEKIDHLIMHQQQELLEIQQVQIDMMNDIMQVIKKK